MTDRERELAEQVRILTHWLRLVRPLVRPDGCEMAMGIDALLNGRPIQTLIARKQAP